MEFLNDALIECVKACGGSKVVGAALFPEFPPDQAQRKLLDCLNPDRPHKISPEQMVLLMRMARAKGCHAAMEFLCAELGYAAPTTVEPKDEMAELMRDFNAAVALQAQIAERMEKAAGRVGLRVAA